MAGCGASTSPEAGATDEALVEAAAAGSEEAELELERRDVQLDELRRALNGLRKQGMSVPRPTESRFERFDRLGALRDRAQDRLFRKSAVDLALDELALKQPPLHVMQWVETDLGNDLIEASDAERERFYSLSPDERETFLEPKVSNEVYARVDRKRWFAMSKRAREEAVEAFYREADAAFRRHGIHDFVLKVAPLTESIARLPALAIGRDAAASLTALGRGKRAPLL